ncbi:MAG: OmpA/MotB family protein [Thermodesulfobacteriota bacterium]
MKPRIPAFLLRPVRGGADDTEDWMITFADAVTLLLTFFVLLLSVADLNPHKYEEIKASMAQAVARHQAETPFTQLSQRLEQLASAGELGQSELNATPRGLVLEFTGTTLYEPGSASLKTQALEILRRVARQITAMPGGDYRVVVEGHTDDVPIKTPQFPSNWELSTQRATNVVRYLIQEGVPASRLQAAGFAETRPKAPNRDHMGRPLPENQAKNRRVVIAVSPAGVGQPEF